ncbi:SDR family oxidoreductase [Bacillus sp. WMMC1349]|uniref:SDR family oxidoreductase n=1 Tax=Bacillus sp. WMMC1349 TaxID=2736254 RepID=UPI0015560E1E|nr:SDR family oxidoreductase [Bacillus sp. WMMC1349]NPC93083.1 SDR family oxidoreductase [Bacillus sp. WMMC1349]
MQKVLVAGASGYLGRYLVQAFKQKGYEVRVLVRNKQKLMMSGPFLEPAVSDLIDEVVVGDVTDPNSIKGVCRGVDIVCSTIGLTRQKGSLTFHHVDYLGNLHLLKEAQKANVRKFMYIHVYKGDEMNNPIAEAKQRFVQELKHSGMNFIIVKPTGYFSDMSEFLKMAQKGRVFLIGDGMKQMNPIHGADLAQFCVDSVLHHDQKELEVGGPNIYRHVEIAAIAFQVSHKKQKLLHIPVALLKALLPFFKILSRKQYALVKFFLDGMTEEAVAPLYGSHDLKTYFKEIVEHAHNKR